MQAQSNHNKQPGRGKLSNRLCSQIGQVAGENHKRYLQSVTPVSWGSKNGEQSHIAREGKGEVPYMCGRFSSYHEAFWEFISFRFYENSDVK